MALWQEMERFHEKYGKRISVGDTAWQYHRLGEGAPILWLTGGLRRSAFGFSFLQKLARRHCVIAPDYPPVQTVHAFNSAFDSILQAEGIKTFALAGQSYGGMLAQVYLAHRVDPVVQLILSSSGPADYGKAWLPVEYAFIGLVRILPEKFVKKMLAGGLIKLLSVSADQGAEWKQAMDQLMHKELTRADVVSHFAVAADMIRKKIVSPAAYHNWTGRITVLSAENDPTQSEKDFPRYEKLFGRPVEVINMGQTGHAAVLSDPDAYLAKLEQVISGK